MSLKNHVSMEVVDGLAHDVAINYGRPWPKDRNTLAIRVDYPTSEYADLEYRNMKSWILMAATWQDRTRKTGSYLLESEYVRNELGLFVDSSAEGGRPDGSRAEKAGPLRTLRAQFILENMREHLELQ